MDAVFAANDQMALGVLHLAWQMGRRVPDALAVVGFDDLPEAPHFCPPLTTIHQDAFQLGCRAVDEILRLIEVAEASEAPGEPRTVLITPELVVRQT
jgi:DNA-binding LacI/PurR family transcriptional regulator